MPKRKKCNRNRVQKMWRRSPLCHWCKNPTTLVESGQLRLHPHSATFDHLHHRSHPLRYTRKGRNAGVLACYECNQRRGRAEHIKTLPLWNRLLLKYKIPIPIWKIRRFIESTKQKIKRVNWLKRHIKYKINKVIGNV